MNTIMSQEEFLKKIIRDTFGNQKRFCEATGIPYMTVSSAIQRGIKNSSIATIERICKGLNLSLSFFLASYQFETQQYESSDMLVENFYNSGILLCHALDNHVKFQPENLEKITQATQVVLARLSQRN